ncbi:MAG TPA: methyltransferase domain-containing protein [Mycobacteriales bacterium]|nr:methyltransferase domain-containing protein [Mycobacteriales bacterium]
MTAAVTGEPAGASPVPRPDAAYWQFYERVAAAQVAAWLPDEPTRVLDLSGGDDRFADQLHMAGHTVVHVVGPDGRPARPWPPDADLPGADGAGVDLAPRGAALPVVADPRRLSWLRDASVDAVLAESRVLSMCLAAEVTVLDLARVLRPGGRLLLVVESLSTGLARLADQGRWAELADVPSADVVLVPAEDGSITRCFWSEELAGLLADAGLDVEWVRPRSVLSPAVVERAIAEGGEEALRLLVRTECALAVEREGESTGLHLLASARRPS